MFKRVKLLVKGSLPALKFESPKSNDFFPVSFICSGVRAVVFLWLFTYCGSHVLVIMGTRAEVWIALICSSTAG